MSFQICKFQLNDSMFLNFRPSIVAACSLILSVNIYERDVQEIQNNNFFAASQENMGLVHLNTDIWNNHQVHQLTGYSITDIKGCLYMIAAFIANNLQPNRLENFDIEAIKNLQNYEGYVPLNICNQLKKTSI